MITINITGPRGGLARAMHAEIERQLTASVRKAAARHGGVTIAFQRKVDGSVRSIDLKGSPAAVDAARAAIGG